jgi:hypothetical protein
MGTDVQPLIDADSKGWLAGKSFANRLAQG